MALIMTIAMPVISWLVTEGAKKVTELFLKNTPPKLVPAISSAVAVAVNEVARTQGIDLFPMVDGQTAETAAAVAWGGGGSAGFNLLLNKIGMTAKKRVVKAIIPLLLLLPLTGCAALERVAEKAKAYQEKFCKYGPVIVSAVHTAQLAAEAKGDEKLAQKFAEAYVVLVEYGPTVCPPVPEAPEPASVPSIPDGKPVQHDMAPRLDQKVRV